MKGFSRAAHLLLLPAFLLFLSYGCKQSPQAASLPAHVTVVRTTLAPATSQTTRAAELESDSPEPPLLSREEFDRETDADAATDREERERREFKQRGSTPENHRGGGDPAQIDVDDHPVLLQPGSSRTHARTRADVDALRRTSRSRQPQDFQITLSNEFIEKYKNRVTLETKFEITGHSDVHDIASDGDDGDIHMGGVSDDIGLPFVAEIMNAKNNPALPLIQPGATLEVAGAWRLWCEHPGAPQIQYEMFENGGPPSNPDHVFEIHPVSRLGNVDEKNSFHQIPGFEAYDASTAFVYYESIPCRIVADLQHQKTTIFTPKAKYNYCEFWMQLDEDKQFKVIDGRIVRCSICDSKTVEPIFRNRRMVFVKDTPPEKIVRDLKKGDRIHVLGIPRIDLALVSWRTRAFHTRPEVLTWKLPYEIIVVGVYND